MTQSRTIRRIAPTNGVWVDLLRANCLTLVERPEIAKAVSLSKAFPHGSEGEREAFIDLAMRMAEEYGLLAEIEPRGYFVTIRFSRQEAETVAPEAPAISLIEKVRTLLKARFGASSESGTQRVEEPAESSREVKS
jgi:hypothetical protein